MMKYFKLVLPRAETCFFTALEAHDKEWAIQFLLRTLLPVCRNQPSQRLPMLSAYVPRSIDTVILDQKHRVFFFFFFYLI